LKTDWWQSYRASPQRASRPDHNLKRLSTGLTHMRTQRQGLDGGKYAYITIK
jgi:hypothetical protein